MKNGLSSSVNYFLLKNFKVRYLNHHSYLSVCFFHWAEMWNSNNSLTPPPPPRPTVILVEAVYEDEHQWKERDFRRFNIHDAIWLSREVNPTKSDNRAIWWKIFVLFQGLKKMQGGEKLCVEVDCEQTNKLTVTLHVNRPKCNSPVSASAPRNSSTRQIFGRSSSGMRGVSLPKILRFILLFFFFTDVISRISNANSP